jgi:hypothetical protein
MLIRHNDVVTVAPCYIRRFSKEKAEAINRYYDGCMRPGDVEIIAGPSRTVTMPAPGQPLVFDEPLIPTELLREDPQRED